MPGLAKNTYFVRKSFPFNLVLIVLIVLSLFQIVALDSSFNNVFSVIFLLISCLLSLLYFQKLSISNFPNSFFVLFGSFLSLCALPIVGRTLVAQSLVQGLNTPIFTFGMVFIFNTCALVSHYFYTHSHTFLRLRSFLRGVIQPANNFSLNNTRALLISFIGFGALFLSAGSDGAVSKLISGFSILTNFGIVAYFLSLFQLLGFGGDRSSPKISLFIPILCFIGSICMGIYLNSRGAFLAPILITGVLLIYLWFSQGYRFKAKYCALVLLSLYLSFILLSGVSSAILVARAYRGSISAGELFTITYDMILSGSKLNQGTDSSSWWRENYYNNNYLDRFSTIQMIDNTLYIARSLPKDERDYYSSFQLIRFTSILPSPILQLFGGSISDKSEVNQLSSADLLYSFYSGRNVMSRLTGSYISDAYILFGWFSPIILLFLFSIMFPLLDIFTVSLNSTRALIPSVLGMLIIPKSFGYLQSDSLVSMSVGIIRLMLELTILFIIVSRFSRLRFVRLK